MAEGLRERKTRATRRAMESAAVDLAYTEGVGAVTVDRVCAAAMVSRSTFFNYFTSLEQAIFGSALDYDREVTDGILARHSGDLVGAASLIVMQSVGGDAADATTQRRLALFVREPGLTSAVSWASHESRERLQAVMSAWLDAHPEHSRLPVSERETEARLTVALSIALGDEVQRYAREADGVVTLDPDAFRDARRRIAAIAMPAE